MSGFYILVWLDTLGVFGESCVYAPSRYLAVGWNTCTLLLCVYGKEYVSGEPF